MARIACALLVSLFFLSGCVTTRFSRGTRSRMPIDDRQSGDFTPISAAKLHRYRLVQLTWPLDSVTVTSPFGFRHGDRHEGLDLRAPLGTPVYAAHSGVVLYSGNGISGYGNMVILKHPSGLATVYAHHSRNLVRRGMQVEQGMKIAVSGSTGHSSGPHLHFEVRDGSDPFDPRLLLPSVNAQERRVLLAKTRTSPASSARKNQPAVVRQPSMKVPTRGRWIAGRKPHRVRPVRPVSVQYTLRPRKRHLSRVEKREAAKQRALARVKLAQRGSI